MKKLLVLALSIMIIACGSLSASALKSPTLDGDPNCNKFDYDSSKCGKSPGTGVSSAYAIYAAIAALTCGGVAVIAKKKISE